VLGPEDLPTNETNVAPFSLLYRSCFLVFILPTILVILRRLFAQLTVRNPQQTLGIGAGIDLNLGWKGRKVKTRTAVLIAVVGIGAFVAIGINRRNAPTQAPGTSSPGRVGERGDSQVKVEAEPTPADPAAKQRAIDAELNRDIRRAIDVEVSRAIQGAPSDAKE